MVISTDKRASLAQNLYATGKSANHVYEATNPRPEAGDVDRPPSTDDSRELQYDISYWFFGLGRLQ